MFRSVVVLSYLVAAFATTPEDRILGGSNAPEGAYPYQVSIRKPTGHDCGGSILSTRYILSAAHCFQESSVKSTWIVVGTNFLSKGGDRYNLTSIIIHKQYKPRTLENDIALLKTTENIIFKATVQPIKIYQREVPAGAILILTGWGYTAWPSKQYPNELQQIHLKKIDNKECVKRMRYKYNIIATEFCTESPAKQGACKGDSGGPLVYNGSQVGIVSWGIPCGTQYPDVFTKLFKYIKWIKNHME